MRAGNGRAFAGCFFATVLVGDGASWSSRVARCVTPSIASVAMSVMEGGFFIAIVLRNLQIQLELELAELPTCAVKCVV